MENLRQYDECEWPEMHELNGYRSQFPPDRDYYDDNGVDHFLELGEWLRDKNIRRRREMEKKKKEAADAQRRNGRF